MAKAIQAMLDRLKKKDKESFDGLIANAKEMKIVNVASACSGSEIQESGA